MDGEFRNKVVLVTGRLGIGAATAKLFARHGAKVVIADWDEPASGCSRSGAGVGSRVGDGDWCGSGDGNRRYGDGDGDEPGGLFGPAHLSAPPLIWRIRRYWNATARVWRRC
jgi:NAD(P)-dependent dehydrogenase (short-subunit alcohol dehydrogenase family)